MNAGTLPTPTQIRKQIGPAFWLLALLGRFAPAEWSGDTAVYVAGGNIITDAELAERLEVSERTISNWRSRLRAAGVIGWLIAPRKGRVFWIAALNSALGTLGELKPGEQQASTETAANTEAASSEPLASRWLQ
jgi:hypothetical protein